MRLNSKLGLIAITICTLSLSACGNKTNSHSTREQPATSKRESSHKKTQTTVKKADEKVTSTESTESVSSSQSVESSSLSSSNSNNAAASSESSKWMINNADEALSYITQQKGDEGWTVVGGTFGGAHSGYDSNGQPNAAPADYVPYCTLQNSDGDMYYVFADGGIKSE